MQRGGTVAETAIEIHSAFPDLRLACVSMVHSRHGEDTVALLHQAHATCQRTAIEVASIGCPVDGGIGGGCAVGALSPCRHVDGEDIGRGTVSHVECGVGVLVEQQVLVVVTAAYGRSTCNLRASSQGQGWWGHSEVFQFSEKETGMRWLVVGVHLPHHGLTVLVVEPQGVDGV